MTNSSEKVQIQFWKLKTFNEKLNASIGFLKQYWQPLLKANAVIAGPLFILGMGFILFYFNVFLQNVRLLDSLEDNQIFYMFGQLFLYVFIGGILYIFSLLGIILVTLEFIHITQTKPSEIHNLKLIFKNARKKALKMIGHLILIGLIYYLVNVGVQIVGLILALIPIFGVFASLGLQIAAYLLFYSFIYLAVPMIYYEKFSFSKMFKQVRAMLRLNFWPTSGMYLGTKAIQFILANGVFPPLLGLFFWYFFQEIRKTSITEEPFAIIEQHKMVFILSMIVIFIMSLLNTASNIFHVVTSAVQYHSLKEQQTGSHLRQQIQNFENLTRRND